MGDGAGSTPDQQTPSDEAPVPVNGGGNPSVGQEPSQTPAPSAPSAAPSAPANGGGNPSAAPSAPANGDSTPAAPETNAPADDQGTVTARVDITPSANPARTSAPASQNSSTPTQARADALAATGASSVWVGGRGSRRGSDRWRWCGCRIASSQALTLRSQASAWSFNELPPVSWKISKKREAFRTCGSVTAA